MSTELNEKIVDTLFPAITLAKKLEITLKSMKSMPTMDGLAWTAVVYHKNRKVGQVEDGGYGGALMMRIPKELEDAIKAEVNGKIIETEFGPLNYDIELFFGQLAEDLDNIKRFKNKTKKTTLFVADPSTMELRTINALGEVAETAIRKSYPSAVILNTLLTTLG